MEFTVRKFDLLQELSLIQGVVERKTTIPILANVLIHAEGGELRIAATDLEIGLKSVCVSKTTGRGAAAPGTASLPANLAARGAWDDASAQCHQTLQPDCSRGEPIGSAVTRITLSLG